MVKPLRILVRSTLRTILDKFGIIERKVARHKNDIIVSYHSIEKTPSDYKYSVSPESLDEHVGYIKKYFDVVTLDQLISEQASNKARLVITFDDAYLDFYEEAFPIFLKHQVPATVFVPTFYIGRSNDEIHELRFGNSKPHMNWDQIRELHQTGLINFECHSHTHEASYKHPNLAEDLQTSLKIFEQELNYRPIYLAYPYGAYTHETDKIALAQGFKRLFSTDYTEFENAINIGRFDVNRNNEKLTELKMTLTQLSLSRPHSYFS